MYLRKVPSLLHRIYKDAIWSSKNRPSLKWTFDDGPHPDSTPYILNLLSQFELKATFFCLGEQAESYPQLVEDIIEQGHQIGSHGHKHLSGWTMSTDDYIANIKTSLNHLNTNLYRPPFGRITQGQYARVRQEMGMSVVMWDRMPGDFDKAKSKEEIADFLKNNVEEESVVVLHDKPECLSKVCFGLSRYYDDSSVNHK